MTAGNSLRSHLPSLLLVLAGFGLDRLHKYLQIEVFDWPERHFVAVGPFLDLGLIYNTGISYSLLDGVPVPVLTALIAVALIGLMIWWWRADSALVRAGLALAIGGAVSNAVDRWVYGAVADFFHLHWQDHSFFVFNLADTAITAGVCLLILDILGIGRRRRA